MTTLTANKVSISERERIECIYFDESLAAGTILNFTISGCSSADIVDGKTTGTITVNNDGKARLYNW